METFRATLFNNNMHEFNIYEIVSSYFTWRHSWQEHILGEQRRQRPHRPLTTRQWPWCRPREGESSGYWPGWSTWPTMLSPPELLSQEPEICNPNTSQGQTLCLTSVFNKLIISVFFRDPHQLLGLRQIFVCKWNQSVFSSWHKCLIHIIWADFVKLYFSPKYFHLHYFESRKCWKVEQAQIAKSFANSFIKV